jgi:arylsulfatase A-like enzyme
LLAPLAAACALAGPGAAAAADHPNIVFILLDDVGYGDLGAYGGSFVATPNLDRLAAEGMRFTQYHSNGAVCTPSRAAILTGRSPINLGLVDVLAETAQRGLPDRIETLAERLRAAGYATGHFGKWHLGHRPEHVPTLHGFDRSTVVGGSNSYFHSLVSIDGGPPFRYLGHRTEFMTDEALRFIEENADRPFFANVWYNAAHRPYEPSPDWAARYPDSETGRYAALLSHADEEIGRILEALQRLGLDSRTLVLVTSDNGGVAKDIPSNGPLRGYKRDLFEGGVRLPLIARWTGSIEAGSENPSLFYGIDFVPTLVGIAGGAAPEGLSGRNMALALLAGEVIRRDEPAFWAFPERLGAPGGPPLPLYRHAVRMGDWKLVRQPQDGTVVTALFDLAADPGEATNLASSHPDLVGVMTRSYRAWWLSDSRLVTPVARVSGPATVYGSWFRLEGGEVELDADRRASAHDGDLSFVAVITPRSLGAEQVIAEHPGSWRLVLSDLGTVRLIAHGQDGIAVEVESESSLQPGVTASVAFTLFGRPGANSELRLFVDAVPEDGSWDLAAMGVSDSAIRIGNDASGARPFRGWLFGPRIHLVSLDAAELADLDADGVPNAQDRCIGVADAGRSDSDGDGIGDACDADLNGNGIVGAADRVLLLRAFGRREGDPLFEPRFDLNGDGVVGPPDLTTLERALGAPPGPSGLVCTRAAPCAGP